MNTPTMIYFHVLLSLLKSMMLHTIEGHKGDGSGRTHHKKKFSEKLIELLVETKVHQSEGVVSQNEERSFK